MSSPGFRRSSGLDNATLTFTIVNMTDDAMQGNRRAGGLDQAELIRRQVVLSRWREAEGKVYPLVMVDPAMYESALTAVGAISTKLRAHYPSQAALYGLQADLLAIEFGADRVIVAAATASHVPLQTLVEAALAKTLPELPG
jgi:hypothetical protein